MMHFQSLSPLVFLGRNGIRIHPAEREKWTENSPKQFDHTKSLSLVYLYAILFGFHRCFYKVEQLRSCYTL